MAPGIVPRADGLADCMRFLRLFFFAKTYILHWTERPEKCGIFALNCVIENCCAEDRWKLGEGGREIGCSYEKRGSWL
jgi:hypothetical protein